MPFLSSAFLTKFILSEALELAKIVQQVGKKEKVKTS
jgi:hypothetical protein